MGVLTHLDKIEQLRVVEGAPVLGPSEPPIAPHLGHLDLPAAPPGLLLDVFRPVARPGLLAVGLVVHAVEHVVVAQAVVEQFVHEPLLNGEQGAVMALVRRGEEERLPVQARVVGITGGQPGLCGGVVDVVGRIVRVRLPVFFAGVVGVVEPVPDLDLDDDVAPGGLAQQPFEPLPVLVVPPVQVIAAVRPARVGMDLETLDAPVAHGVADVVAARGREPVQLGDQLLLGPLEQVVVVRAAKEQHGLAVQAPVPGVRGPGAQGRRFLYMQDRTQGQGRQQAAEEKNCSHHR